MRKAILVFVASAFVSFTYAQDANFDVYKRIESDKVLNLSADQIAKIKKLNREVGAKFRAIGKSNLPGYEHKAAIRKILMENQVKTWESHYESIDYNDGMKKAISDRYDNRLEQLEKKFEREKEAIEDSDSPKDVKKEKIKVLKNRYKAEKERLKQKRNAAKHSKG